MPMMMSLRRGIRSMRTNRQTALPITAETPMKMLAIGADLAIPWVRRIMLAAVILAIAQQLTGINSVMYYGTEMLKTAGFSD
ncbi:MFS transporter, partial [Mycobacterium kansasii]